MDPLVKIGGLLKTQNNYHYHRITDKIMCFLSRLFPIYIKSFDLIFIIIFVSRYYLFGYTYMKEGTSCSYKRV